MLKTGILPVRRATKTNQIGRAFYENIITVDGVNGGAFSFSL